MPSQVDPAWDPTVRDQCLEEAKAHMRSGQFNEAIRSLLKANAHCSCYHRVFPDGQNIDLHHLVERNPLEYADRPEADPNCPVEIFFPEVCDNALNRRLNLFLDGGDIWRILPELELDDASSKCDCTKTFPWCDDEVHTSLLSTLCQALESGWRHADAIRVAYFMMRVQPQSPEGYCRLAKVLRFLDRTKDNSQRTVNQAQRVQIRWALELNCNFGVLFQAVVLEGLSLFELRYPDRAFLAAPKFALLQKMAAHIRSKRRDRVMALPAELRVMIFRYLNMKERGKCMQVNRAWEADMKSEHHWRRLVLATPVNRRKVWTSRFQAHPNIQEMIVADAKFLFPKQDRFLTLLPYLQNLQVLELAYSRPDRAMHLVNPIREPAGGIIPPIRTLKLVGEPGPNCSMFTWLIRILHGTLEELSVTGICEDAANLFTDQLPGRLKVMSLRGSRDAEPMRVQTYELSLRFPHLEQLRLDRVEARGLPQGHPDLRARFPSLRVLVLGREFIQDLSQASTLFPHLPKGLRVLEILPAQVHLASQVILHLPGGRPFWEVPEDAPEELPIMQELEVFRTCSRLRYFAWLRHILEAPLRNGTLHTLDLCLSHSVHDTRRTEYGGIDNSYCPEPEGVLDFTFSDSITTLGLSRFSWLDPKDYLSTFSAGPFLRYLDHFPNVQTVRLYPGVKANTLPLVLEILERRDRVRVIYQDCLDPREWYIAKVIAGQKGVKIYHQDAYPECAPVTFPRKKTWR